MKVILVNRHFYPDRSPTTRLVSDLAFRLAEQQQEVHVVTSRVRLDAPSTLLQAEEELDGVQIHRLWTSRLSRRFYPARLADYLTFHLATEKRLLELVDRGDRVVATSEPPGLSSLVAGIARRRNALQINWLHELFPEAAITRGLRSLRGRIGRQLIAARTRALENSYMTVVPGDRMRDRLIEQGLDPNKVRVIRDWVDGRELAPIGDQDNPLRERLGLRGRFVVGYVGDLNRGHDYQTLINAADRLRGEPGIRFLIAGGGSQMNAMRKEAKRRNLANLVFEPFPSPDDLRMAMGLPDIHLLSLRPEMEGLLVPGKFYRIVAAGKPMLFVGAADGEVGRWVHRARMGTTVEPGDGGRLARRILLMRMAPERLERMGENARLLYRARFASRKPLIQWSELLGMDEPAFPSVKNP